MMELESGAWATNPYCHVGPCSGWLPVIGVHFDSVHS